MSTRPKRRPRPVRIPITSREVPDTFGWQMHCSLAALRVAPTREHFDGVAICLNVVQLAIAPHAKFANHALRINAGARALNDLARKVVAIENGTPLPLREHELAPIEVAITAADEVIPRLGVNELNEARLELRARRAQREAAPCR